MTDDHIHETQASSVDVLTWHSIFYWAPDRLISAYTSDMSHHQLFIMDLFMRPQETSNAFRCLVVSPEPHAIFFNVNDSSNGWSLCSIDEKHTKNLLQK